MSTPNRLILMAPRPLDLVETGVDGAPITLLCCEGGSEVEHAAGRLRMPAICLEDELGERRRWTNVDVGLLAPLLSSCPDSVVLPYAASPALEVEARRIGLAVAAIPADLKQHVDDKAWLRGTLQDLGIRVPRSIPLGRGLRPSLFDRLGKKLGVPFVLQPRRGAGGRQTSLVSTRLDLKEHCDVERGDDWLAAEFVGSTTINVHGVIHDLDVNVSWPTVQLTGIDELTSGWGAYCGSDAAAIRGHDAEVVEAVDALTRRVGDLLRDVGYRGVFGVDFSIESNAASIAVLEVNPRFQASSWLVAGLEASSAVPTVVNRHLASFGFARRLDPEDGLGAPPDAAFLVAFNKGDCRRVSAIRTGVYAFEVPPGDRPALRFRRAGSFSDCGMTEVYLGGTPGSGVDVDRGASMIRAATRQALAKPDGRSLTAFGAQVAAAVRELLTPLSEGDLERSS